MTDVTFLAFCRSLLDEPTATYWEDTEIEAYRDTAIINVINEFWYLIKEGWKDFEKLSIASGNPVVELPSNCRIPLKVEIAATGKNLDYIRAEELHKYKIDNADGTARTGEPEAWMMKNGKIYVIPTPDKAYTTEYRLWFAPDMTDLTTTPKELHAVIALDTVILAKVKDEEMFSELMKLRKKYERNALKALTVAQLQEPSMMSDEAIEDITES